MKAEHRKELETNALADRVGRALQGMKQAPQKKTMLWLVLVVVVAIVGWLYFRYRERQQNAGSEQWVMLENGHPDFIKTLIQQSGQSNQRKAALFEYSYADLRLLLKYLPSNSKEVLAMLDSLEKKYGEMAALCQDDKVLNPEALYALAVISETRIMKTEANWKDAQAAYHEVVTKHKDTAFGKLAQKRLEIFSDEAKRRKLLDIYQDLRIEFVKEDRIPLPPTDIMPFDPPLKPPEMPLIP